MAGIESEEQQALECCIQDAESQEEVQIFEELKEYSYGE